MGPGIPPGPAPRPLEPLRLSGAEHEEDLGAVRRQERTGDTRPCTQRLEGLNVLADACLDFTTGQLRTAQMQHRPVPVASQCRRQQMPVVNSDSQSVRHSFPSCAIRSRTSRGSMNMPSASTQTVSVPSSATA